MGAVSNREGEGEARTGKAFIFVLEVHPFYRKMPKLFSFSTKQHLKKSKQTEEDMLYGTIIRTPTKRRFLGTPTPNKSRKVSNLSLFERVVLRRTHSAPPVLCSNLLSYFNQFNATSSSSSATPNSTMRCAFGGTVCRSPVPRLPLSANKVRFIVRLTEDLCRFGFESNTS